jgi:hypothetical protein
MTCEGGSASERRLCTPPYRVLTGEGLSRLRNRTHCRPSPPCAPLACHGKDSRIPGSAAQAMPCGLACRHQRRVPGRGKLARGSGMRGCPSAWTRVQRAGLRRRGRVAPGVIRNCVDGSRVIRVHPGSHGCWQRRMTSRLRVSSGPPRWLPLVRYGFGSRSRRPPFRRRSANAGGPSHEVIRCLGSLPSR